MSPLDLDRYASDERRLSPLCCFLSTDLLRCSPPPCFQLPEAACAYSLCYSYTFLVMRDAWDEQGWSLLVLLKVSTQSNFMHIIHIVHT